MIATHFKMFRSRVANDTEGREMSEAMERWANGLPRDAKIVDTKISGLDHNHVFVLFRYETGTDDDFSRT